MLCQVCFPLIRVRSTFNLHRWVALGKYNSNRRATLFDFDTTLDHISCCINDGELFLHVFTCMEKHASYASFVLLKHIHCITFFFIDKYTLENYS